MDFSVFEVDEVPKELGFHRFYMVNSYDFTIFTLSSAALYLVGYTMMSLEDQHQEFAFLPVIGTKPKAVIIMLAVQSLIELFSSFPVVSLSE